MERPGTASDSWILKELLVGRWLQGEHLRQMRTGSVIDHCYRRHTSAIISSIPSRNHDFYASERPPLRTEDHYALTCVRYRVTPKQRREVIRSGLEDQKVEELCLAAMHKALSEYVSDQSCQARHLEADARPRPIQKTSEGWKKSLFLLQEILVLCVLDKGMSRNNLREVAGIMQVLGFQESLMRIMPSVLESDPADHDAQDKQALLETQRHLDWLMVECALAEGVASEHAPTPYPGSAGTSSRPGDPRAPSPTASASSAHDTGSDMEVVD